MAKPETMTRLDRDLREALKRRAIDEGRTLKAATNEAVRRYLRGDDLAVELGPDEHAVVVSDGHSAPLMPGQALALICDRVVKVAKSRKVVVVARVENSGDG